MCLDMVWLTDCLIQSLVTRMLDRVLPLEVMSFLEFSFLPLTLTGFTGVEKNVPLPQSLFILFTVCPFYFQPTSVVEFGLTFLQTAWIWVTFFLFLNACCQSLS